MHEFQLNWAPLAIRVGLSECQILPGETDAIGNYQ